jgi:hypothetical protein
VSGSEGPVTSDRAGPSLTLLVDVDNTLLDNDRVSADLRTFLAGEVGLERERRY